MTTTVTVTTHSWPVEVTTTDQYRDRDSEESRETVQPNSTRTWFMTDTRSLAFQELPLPASEVEGAPASGAADSAIDA